MKDNIIQVIKLVIICVIAAAVLASVYRVTEEPIKRAIAEETVKAVKSVVTGYNDAMSIDTVSIEDNGEFFKVFTVINESGQIIGRSIVTFSKNGYGGTIDLMVGVDTTMSISGIYVLSHKETPGLGSKMDEAFFKDQFINKNVGNFKFSVNKDGGDIAAITSATITSRAVTEAVERGLSIITSNFMINNNALMDSLIMDNATDDELEEVENVN